MSVCCASQGCKSPPTVDSIYCPPHLFAAYRSGEISKLPGPVPAPASTSRDQMQEVMNTVFTECHKLRKAGQAEYAHREENAFANFERVAERLGLSREQVLLVFAEKHLDGIHAWAQGHRSQRENVRGRINDVIVYMTLLRGMVEESESRGEAHARTTSA